MNLSCPLVTDDRELENFLTNHPRVIGLLFARWCPFCLQFLSIFQRYAQHHPDLFLLIQDDQERLADRYHVDVIPTVLYFEQGKIVRRLDGIPGMGLTDDLFVKFVEACPKA